MSLLNKAQELDYDKLADHTQEQEFESHKVPEGSHWGRVCWYVELGEQFVKGNPKFKTSDRYVKQVLVGIELSSHKARYTITVDGKDKEIRPIIYKTYAISTHSRAGFKKFFDLSRNGNEKIRHGAQLLGKAVSVTIVHNTVKDDKTGKSTTYVNWHDTEGNPFIGPDMFTNPLTGEVIKLPTDPLLEDSIRLFVWDQPDMEQWNSLFIAGEHKVVKKVNGEEVEETRSKNWIQDRITGANNFTKSAMYDILRGDPDWSGVIAAVDEPPVELIEPDEPASEPETAKDERPATTTQRTEKAVGDAPAAPEPVKKAEENPEQTVADVLATLGF